MDEMPEEAVLTAAVDEVNRYANLDRLVPSYHNIITVAAIEVRKMLVPPYSLLMMSITVASKDDDGQSNTFGHQISPIVQSRR